MKLLFTLLLCLLLAGCSAPEAPPDGQTLPPETLPVLSDSPYGSGVEAYVLPLSDVQTLCAMDGGLLLQSGSEMIYLGEELQITGSATLDFLPRIRCSGSFLTAFKEDTRQLLILNKDLQQLHCLTLPTDLSGDPVLSTSGENLYYCTDTGIYCWELTSGIRRRIRESDYADQQLVGLHWDDTVLQCRISSENRQEDLFLRCDTGQYLASLTAPAELKTHRGRYYCTYTSGTLPNACFGSEGQETMGLFPEDLSQQTVFLPESHSALLLTSQPENMVKVESCDLSTGHSTGCLLLTTVPIAAAEWKGKPVLLLQENGQDLLLLWHTSEEGAGSESCIAPWFTSDDPEHPGLVQCRDYARQLSEAYGVDIRIQGDAVAPAPWDYALEAEYRCPVILSQLRTLEQCLRQYPVEMLRLACSPYDSVQICLVQTITGTESTQSLSAPTGIQFFRDKDACIVLAAGPYQEQAFHHEIFHLLETRILSCSNALDRWEELNPAGFSYDLKPNSNRNSGVYLSGSERAFVDTYSMSYPKEDRARIFEYAMLPDSEDIFRSGTMQSKLLALCTGIREAFDLEAQTQPLLWEQYLE